MLTQEQKLQIIQDNATHEGDTVLRKYRLLF